MTFQEFLAKLLLKMAASPNFKDVKFDNMQMVGISYYRTVTFRCYDESYNTYDIAYQFDIENLYYEENIQEYFNYFEARVLEWAEGNH